MRKTPQPYQDCNSDTSSPSLCSWSGSWSQTGPLTYLKQHYRPIFRLVDQPMHPPPGYLPAWWVCKLVKYLPKRPISIKPNGSHQYSLESLLFKRRPFCNDAAWNWKGLQTYSITIYLLESYSVLSSHFSTFSFSETWVYQQEPENFWKTCYRKCGSTAHSKGWRKDIVVQV